MEPMEPIRRQDFVHALMVKLNRVSIAAILTLVAIYSLMAFHGTTTSTATQGSATSGAAQLTTTGLTTTGLTGCGGGSSSGSSDRWTAPMRGPR